MQAKIPEITSSCLHLVSTVYKCFLCTRTGDNPGGRVFRLAEGAMYTSIVNTAISLTKLAHLLRKTTSTSNRSGKLELAETTKFEVFVGSREGASTFCLLCSEMETKRRCCWRSVYATRRRAFLIFLREFPRETL